MEILLFAGICLMLIVCAAAVGGTSKRKKRKKAVDAPQMLTSGIGNLVYRKKEETVLVQRGSCRYRARVRLLCAGRGAEVFEALRQVNQYNPAPPEGKEYLMAMLEVMVLDVIDGTGPIYISPYDVECRRANGMAYALSSLIAPQPAMRASLQSGNTAIGWVAFEVDQTDPAPQLIFGQNYDGSGGARFAPEKNGEGITA